MPYGKSRYGDTIYAGEAYEAPTPVISSSFAPVKGIIGCGEWTAQILERGGSMLVYEAPFSGGGVGYVLNNSGSGRITLPTDSGSRSSCCEILMVTEPYEHELVLYRDEQFAFGGPVTGVNTESGEITARDLSSWMDVRFVDDIHADGDSAAVFKMVFDNAYLKDPSPNIQLSTRASGIQTTVDVRAVEFRSAADVLRSLSSYGIDWTVIGRTIVAGGQEVFQGGGETLLLHDDGVTRGNMSKEGVNLATDLALFGSRGNQSELPVTGRAVTGTTKYGLVQRSATDLLVSDKVAADAGALARLQAMQPSPRRVTVTLSDKAAFQFSDLIPGRQMDVRLYDSLDCGQIEQVMRLQQVDVTLGDDEEITLTLIPLGVLDAE